MSTGIGDLVATVSANTAPFESAMAMAGKRTIEFGERVNSLIAPLRHMTAVVEETAGQLLSLLNPVDWLSKGFNLLMYPLQMCARQFEGIMDAGKAVESFTRLENATVRLGAAMKNAGGNIGVTMTEMEKLTRGRAGGLEGMTTLVESGLKGGALAATFQSAKDLAAMMGSDLPTAANMLGTAMEFPERAVRMLREAHIKLSESQQEAIASLSKMGETGQAQAIILAAVQAKTEGVADAMRGTLGGQMKEFSGAIDHLSEIFGEALKPTMEAVVALFKDLANWVASAKSSILAFGESGGNAFKSVTEPLQTMIALLRAGETEAAFLKLQVLWNQTIDRFREGTDLAKTFFADLGSFLMALFERLGTFIQIKINRVLDFGGEISEQMYAQQEADAKKNLAYTVTHAGKYFNNLSGLPMQDSAATIAAKAAYEASKGAKALSGEQAAAAFESAMGKSADALEKAGVQEQATAAQALAAELHDWKISPVATDVMDQHKAEKIADKFEAQPHGPSALEKGSAAAWTGILDAIAARNGYSGPMEETADNTKKIADWCDNNPGFAKGPIAESDLSTVVA